MLIFALINWDVVGAIGEWAGAIFTAIAVWVAISSSRLSFIPRVKVEVSNGFLTYGSKLSPLHLFCKVTNVGLSTVTIETLSIIQPGKTSQLFFPEQTSGQLPARLERSENRRISIKMQDLVEALLKNSTKGKIKIRICFYDSFGRKYFGKWLININQFL